MYVTPVYAGFLIIMFIALAIRIILLRGNLKISLGDEGNTTMIRAVRVHANFAEYIPLALLVMMMLELQGASSNLIHGLGAALVIGRISHAYGVSQQDEKLAFRVFGMVMTFSVLGVAAVRLLSGYLM